MCAHVKIKLPAVRRNHPTVGLTNAAPNNLVEGRNRWQKCKLFLPYMLDYSRIYRGSCWKPKDKKNGDRKMYPPRNLSHITLIVKMENAHREWSLACSGKNSKERQNLLEAHPELEMRKRARTSPNTIGQKSTSKTPWRGKIPLPTN